MNTLPDELRLQIIEYTAPARDVDRYSSVGISDYTLLQHIHQYDPHFDYNEWKRLHRMKSMHQDTEYINDILSVEKKYRMPVHIVKDLRTIYSRKSVILLDVARMLDVDMSLIDIKDCSSGRCIYVDHPTITSEDLQRARIYRDPYPDYSYEEIDEDNHSSDMLFVTNIPDVNRVQDAHIAMISNVPDTLEECLTRAVSEVRTRIIVTEMAAYPLFELLNSTYFSILYDRDHPYDLYISSDGLSSDEIIAHFPSEYHDSLSVNHDLYYGCYSLESLVDDIIMIHNFFYPTKYVYCL